MAALSRLAIVSWSPVLRLMTPASLITLVGVLGGGAALVGAVRGAPLLVTLGITLAMITDYLDGMVARRFGWESPMGAALDSLSDALAFVAAPAISLARLSGTGADGGLDGGLITACAALYLACGAGRLAAFHVVGTQVVRGRVCFIGVPTPAAAALFLPLFALVSVIGAPVLAAVMVALGLLMVSALPYPKRGFHEVLCAACAALALVLQLGRLAVR